MVLIFGLEPKSRPYKELALTFELYQYYYDALIDASVDKEAIKVIAYILNMMITSIYFI